MLTATLFALLWYLPFWLAFVPGILLAHRMGVLLHEYLHGIPFRRYRDNLAVYGFFDGLTLMFGLLELFRGTHLAHHRWLNAEGDSGFRSAQRTPARNRLWRGIVALEAVQHFIYLFEAFRGRQPYVRVRRIGLGFALSLVFAGFWWQAGRGDIVLKLLALNAFTALVPVSLRGAVEHHSVPGDPGFANEYRVWIPLFNLNRHVHHHEDVRCPWYRLEFRTPHPLSPCHYYTHWFQVYVKHECVLMRPMPAGNGMRTDDAKNGCDQRRHAQLALTPSTESLDSSHRPPQNPPAVEKPTNLPVQDAKLQGTAQAHDHSASSREIPSRSN